MEIFFCSIFRLQEIALEEEFCLDNEQNIVITFRKFVIYFIHHAEQVQC